MDSIAKKLNFARPVSFKLIDYNITKANVPKIKLTINS